MILHILRISDFKLPIGSGMELVGMLVFLVEKASCMVDIVKRSLFYGIHNLGWEYMVSRSARPSGVQDAEEFIVASVLLSV